MGWVGGGWYAAAAACIRGSAEQTPPLQPPLPLQLLTPATGTTHGLAPRRWSTPLVNMVNPRSTWPPCWRPARRWQQQRQRRKHTSARSAKGRRRMRRWLAGRRC
jgi:hypothetical protein